MNPKGRYLIADEEIPANPCAQSVRQRGKIEGAQWAFRKLLQEQERIRALRVRR